MLSKNRIKQIQALQLKKNRDRERRFIVEGRKTVLEVMAEHQELVEEVVATPGFMQQNGGELKKYQVPVTEVSAEELEKISLQATPAGILAVCRYFEEQPAVTDFNDRFSLYLDEIRDPGNFGTIIRLADWFGVSAVFCSPNCCDLYNPKVIQATMGAFLRVKVHYVELAELLNEQGSVQVYGAVLNGNNLYRETLQNGLIVIGNEANGISPANLQLVNRPLTIPAHQQNGSESLNAAMAASVIVSEFFRQLRS